MEPSNSTHRQYEALRAFFVEGLPSAEAAARFGYTPGSFRVLVHQFRTQPEAGFLPPDGATRSAARQAEAAPGSGHRSAEAEPLRPRHQPRVGPRRRVAQPGGGRRHPEGRRLRQAAAATATRSDPISLVLRVADPADVRQLDLSPRHFRTKFGGLFLFLPYLVSADLDAILARCGFPGSKMIPAGCAMRSLLALKLFGNARHSHVMSSVLDEGLALFAGLNVIPKRSFLTEYSCRINPACYPELMRDWFDVVNRLGLKRGTSFDLDFHTIPFHGEDALVEKHYVSKRSRRQKGMLAFLAQDAETRVFCYANGELRKDQQNDEIIRFVEFWKQRTGQPPRGADLRLQADHLCQPQQVEPEGIQFITLRRRSQKLLDEVARTPASAWRRIELESVSRAYKTPRVLDRRIRLKDYDGPLRQLTITDLGHEQPTLLLTNQLNRSAAQLIGRYAQRMLIENNIEDGIDFFHMDALSSAVAMKINCDLQLTLMASSLYRLLAVRVGNGYEIAKSRHLFRDFIDASAGVEITEEEIVVRIPKACSQSVAGRRRV